MTQATATPVPARPRRLAVLLVVLIGVLALLAAGVVFVVDGGHAPTPAATPVPVGKKPALQATPANLVKVFAAAAPGATIRLAAGDYGIFEGGRKSAPVTLAPAPGAGVRMGVDFGGGVAGVRLDGLTITGAEIKGRARDVTIARSTFIGQIVIKADRMTDAGIALEGNRFGGIDVCKDCYEGRIHVLGSSGESSGVVIRNNAIGPGGNADGIQVSATGVQILGNTFTGIHQDEAPDAPHTDALQLYGASRTVIRGNYFKDVATAIMSPDGGDHEQITDNVIDTGGYPYAIMLGGDDGSVISHNTMPELGDCYDGAPCGTLTIAAGPDGVPGRGTVVTDNILGRLSVSDGSRLAADTGNLVAVDGGGPRDASGVPTFSGGAAPTARAGFALAAGSPGLSAASDGADVGAAVAPAG